MSSKGPRTFLSACSPLDLSMRSAMDRVLKMERSGRRKDHFQGMEPESPSSRPRERACPRGEGSLVHRIFNCTGTGEQIGSFPALLPQSDIIISIILGEVPLFPPGQSVSAPVHLRAPFSGGPGNTGRTGHNPSGPVSAFLSPSSHGTVPRRSLKARASCHMERLLKRQNTSPSDSQIAIRSLSQQRSSAVYWYEYIRFPGGEPWSLR